MLGWAVILGAFFMGIWSVSFWWLLPLALVAIAVSYVYTGATRLVADIQSDHPVQGFVAMFFMQLLFAGLLYGLGRVVGGVF